MLDNDIFVHDPTAWRVFEVLLCICDQNGKWSGGRYQLAELTHIKPGTLYDALKRLKNAKMATLMTNNKYTTISICNWSKYQSSDNTSTNIKPTSNQHYTFIIKNKECIYNERTIKICELLGIEPTKGMESYVNDIYKGFYLKEPTIACKEWCDNNNVKATSLRWMNWIRREARDNKLRPVKKD